MPVEVSRIKGRLRELFPKANLSTKRLDEISARLAKKPADDADETAIDQVINDANDYIPFADIAKEDDRIRNLEANQKKNEPAPADEPTPTPSPNPTPAPTDNKDDMPAWAKSLMETVNEIKTGKVIETKTAQARKVFDGNETFKSLNEKAKEFYFKQIDVNSETPIEDQISELETTHTEIYQSKADASGYAGKPPAGGNTGKATEAEIKAIVG